MTKRNTDQSVPSPPAVAWLRFVKLLLTVLVLALTAWRSALGLGS